MTDVTALLDAIVDALRGIPELAEQLTGAGETAAIYAYPSQDPEARSLEEAVQAMSDPSAMVAFRGMALGARGGIPQFQFHFSIILRASGELDQGPGMPGYFTLFNSIVEGKPETSGGVRFIDTVIHPDFDPPEEVSFAPALDANKAEYWTLNFALMNVGG